MTGPTVRSALQTSQALGLDRLDAQLLLLFALGRPAHDRAWLLSHDTDALDAAVDAGYQALCARRLAGEPVAYLVGHKEFFGLDLAVDARVLVPRPDTETLVHWALEVLHETPTPAPAEAIHLLDLGTGSGAIALALASSLQASGRPARVSAVDASADALAVARGNAQALGLTVRWLQSNWLEEVSGHFHLIVSNPPYIADGDPHLAALTHEPLQALTAGADGLDDIRRIVAQAPAHLLPGGWLLLEHGYDQAAAVRQLLEAGGFVQVQSRRDLPGMERCSGGRLQLLP